MRWRTGHSREFSTDLSACTNRNPSVTTGLTPAVHNTAADSLVYEGIGWTSLRPAAQGLSRWGVVLKSETFRWPFDQADCLSLDLTHGPQVLHLDRPPKIGDIVYLPKTLQYTRSQLRTMHPVLADEILQHPPTHVLASHFSVGAPRNAMRMLFRNRLSRKSTTPPDPPLLEAATLRPSRFTTRLGNVPGLSTGQR